MTGRIKSLSSGNGSGLIAGDNGVSAHFLSSAVLEYDVTCLAVGQMVTFDLESDGPPTMAVNVCVQRQHRLPLTPSRHQESDPLRYVGFRQVGCTREYKFERLKPGEPTETLVVAVDMALFRKYRVGIQEGPGLCLRELETGPATPGLRHALTDRNMLAYLASRPAPRPKPRHIPPPRHPAPV
jgi:cold shock CspA family protein